jgi:hypothetical protein
MAASNGTPTGAGPESLGRAGQVRQAGPVTGPSPTGSRRQPAHGIADLSEERVDLTGDPGGWTGAREGGRAMEKGDAGAERTPRLRIAAVPGPGVGAVATMLAGLASSGALENTIHAMHDGWLEFLRDGMSNCHHISLGLLMDLDEAGESAWRLLCGTYHGGIPHSWLENGWVSVDGSTYDDDGEPRLLVMERSAYAAETGAVSVAAFSPEDVVSGRYRRERFGG